ncbi:hypothetical protein M231_05948 [Tremella mesenterica]|uniref:HECT-type E3 ubiquitin transferase n=1 Tax=Tremella mesenterica TaxID=5217 RepID=A0A4V1M3G5_TREME|nr:hypothetical protein M231_05948 [Tremella mesenterica]
MEGSEEEEEEHSGEEDEEEEHPGPPGGAGAGAGIGGINVYDRLARLAGESGMHLDEATAAALFGGEFRTFGGIMSGLSTRFKRLKNELRSPAPAVRLTALRECSEILLVSNEDTLGGAFSTNAFAVEFIAILGGKPNIDENGPKENERPPEEMDEDAQLAAALSMSAGAAAPIHGNEDEIECQLVACRCLAHLLEALPMSGHMLVNLGAIPILCSKLNEMSFVELAEQTLSTLEKLSLDNPSAIVREGGLGSLLNFLPFFSTAVQRTAVTAAANCCRNISPEHHNMIRDVFPILRETLTQADQRLVEQATLAVVRTIESYRHRPDLLDGLLDVPTVAAINALLMPSGGSPLLTPSTYTHLLKALTSAARGSAKVSLAFLQAGMTNTVYQILTGVLPPAHDGDEQGGTSDGQGLYGGVADMAVLQNLAHRPKDQVEESLALICELMPPPPRDGVFDYRAYGEKYLAKVKKARRSERLTRRTSAPPALVVPPPTTEPATLTIPATPTGRVTPPGAASRAVRDAMIKAKKDAEQQQEQRVTLLRDNSAIVAKFIKAMIPVLVDVYAASVATRVRTKVLNGLVKAVAFVDSDDLKAALQTVPMASFLGAIISSKDNPVYVLQALQLVELLVTKLPEVYQTSFLREGVVFEIETLAAQDLTPKPVPSDETTVKIEPEDPSQPISISEDLKPLLGSNLSSLLELSHAARSKTPSVNPNDTNILRARVLIAKKVFDVGGDHKKAASVLLDDLGTRVKLLADANATEADLRDSLRHIAEQFSDPSQALSSFELLKSGLVDGLLDFVDVDGTVSSSERRALLYEIFSTDSSGPLTLLVKRLHESLGRLETFEVETAFGGLSDSSRSSSGLGRTMRIRLQAEEGQDIPKAVSNISVTIQAVAPLQALHDYLRPRIADGHFMSGGGLGGLGESLQAAGMTGLTQVQAAPSSAPESSRLAPPAPANPTNPAPPQRRRSARLSGQPQGANPPEPASPVAPLSSSAPEPSNVPEMPLVDFDEYSEEEDFDADVFDEDMEEEINRPVERVVNMSVAPDGSKVEAKTPEGTRIGTPLQVAPGPSAPARMPSYAGAVKAPPVNFHLKFSFNGIELAPNETIYGIVHKHQHNVPGIPFGGSTYGAPVTFKFRKVEGPAMIKFSLDAPSPASVASTMPGALDPSTPTSKLLRLLRVLHNLCAENRDASGRMDVVDENLFINNKLTAKLTRQMEEVMIIASNCLPDWASELPKHFAFLFPFETRYAFLQATSFGYQRLLSRSAAQTRSSNRREDFNPFSRISRQKVRISRAQLLESCVKVMELYGTASGILEVEYFDEIGTGLGPTLEFYSIASREFARRALQIWRDEDEAKPGPYVFHPRGLFPAPVGPGEPASSVAGSRLSWFKTLGLFVGRALLDSRIIDVNLNKLFLKLILGKTVKKSISNLKLVDPALARSLERLQSYLIARKEIEALALPASSRRNKLSALTVGGAKLTDLSLDFTLPGYAIDLRPRGAFVDVDDSNLEEYIDKVLDLTLGSGIHDQVKAFQDGFSMIFPIQDMAIFSPEELGVLFGNADEDWSRETLEQAIKADHGYNLDSRAVQNLLEVMSGYDKDERRHFLQFITGAPKLPIGGFRGLQPPFTVVRKPHEAPFRADDYLPSVMTCAQVGHIVSLFVSSTTLHCDHILLFGFPITAY